MLAVSEHSRSGRGSRSGMRNYLQNDLVVDYSLRAVACIFLPLAMTSEFALFPPQCEETSAELRIVLRPAQSTLSKETAWTTRDSHVQI